MHNLEQLGPTGFQDLSAALAVAVFGPEVQVMGAGRDGGRDMYYRGELPWTGVGSESPSMWSGYTVFQVKHKARLTTRPQDDASWLWAQVRAELDDWADKSLDREPLPDNLVFVTNVPLTPVPKSGGHDELLSDIAAYITKLDDDSRDINDVAAAERVAKFTRLSRIKRYGFWDGNKLQTLLNVHGDVRRAFNAFLTAADVFGSLAQFTDKLPLDKLEPGLRSHARTTLMGEGVIYFDEAGSGDTVGFPVHEMAIDLPIVSTGQEQRSTVVNVVLDRAEHVLRPSVTTISSPRHLLITGAPGNGKTTISKFLIQVFRASMLAQGADLSVDNRRVISGTEAALKRLKRNLPKNRRWPMRIDLAEYAQEGGLIEDSTLLRWIAQKVSKRSNLGEVTPQAMLSWMQQWPWFLVLDGLDEVTEASLRKRLVQQVTEFVNDAEATNCDVLVILTTRPVGYTENIAPTQFERIDLDYLEPDEAVRYGALATKVRLRADVDRIEKVMQRLKEAASDESMKNLLRTPLQVLILTIIVDAAGQLAPDRYSLFWGYYETVFKRERGKQGGLHRILRDHSQQIQQLHERIGFELQVRSEAGDRSFATLTYDELQQITWSVLDDAGFKPAGPDSNLMSSLLAAATQRLVLIAPRGEHGFGFDVRSLQELMAAMHLTSGPLHTTIARMRTSAPSPHWRNAWIFAAGRLFSTPLEHQHQAVVELIESVDKDADYRLGTVVPIGPVLALEVIDDGMAASLPKWRARIGQHGLRVLRAPSSADLPAITRTLVRFAEGGDEQRRAVGEALRDSLAGTEVARDTAARVQKLIPGIADELGAGLQTRALSRARKRPSDVPVEPSAERWSEFQTEIDTSPISGEALVLLSNATDAVRGARRDADKLDVATMQAALGDHAASEGLAAALAQIDSDEPAIVRKLRDEILPPIFREPIGETLRQLDGTRAE